MLMNDDYDSSLPLLVLVDDDNDVLSALIRALRGLEINIKSFDSAIKALDFCKHNQPEIVISDQQMPELDGCEFLNKIKNIWPKSQRIILSAQKNNVGFYKYELEKN